MSTELEPTKRKPNDDTHRDNRRALRDLGPVRDVCFDPILPGRLVRDVDGTRSFGESEVSGVGRGRPGPVGSCALGDVEVTRLRTVWGEEGKSRGRAVVA